LPAAPPRSPVSPARQPQDARAVEGERPKARPIVKPAAPPPSPKLEVKRLATAPGKTIAPKPVQVSTKDARRQLNIHFAAADFDRLTERAVRVGSTAPSLARATVIASLDKPTVPAAVTAAAIRHGAPICDFVRMLLTVGLAAFEHDAAVELAA
jgi:hypothetical protein